MLSPTLPFRNGFLLLLLLSSSVHSAEAIHSIIADVIVNLRPGGTHFLAEDREGRIYAPAEALQRWRIDHLPSESARIDQLLYYPLDQLPGLHYTLDPSSYTLHLEVPGELLDRQRYGASRATVITPQPGSGAALQYGISLQRSASGEQDLNLTLKPTLFHQGWVFSQQLSAQQSHRHAYSMRHLESSLTHDDPAKLRTLRLGDATLEAHPWGGGVRFGGVQWAANFNLDQGLIPFPLPLVEGVTTLPSVVDLYLNERQILTQEVEPGPFQLDHLPLTSGAGDLRMVIRDRHGQEREVSQQFFVSTRLLKPGLSAWSLAAGSVRRDYAVRDYRYGDPLFAANYRRGITTTTTLGGHLYTTADQQVAAATLDLATAFGELFAAYAHSQEGQQQGDFQRFGVRYSSPRFNLGATHARWSPAFRSPGSSEPPRLRQQRTLTSGVHLGQHGSLTLLYAQQQGYQQPQRERATLSHRRRLSGRIQLALSLTLEQGEERRNLGGGISLNFPLGGHHTSLGYTQRNQQQSLRGHLSRSLGAGERYGYQVQLHDQGLDSAELSLRSAIGTHRLSFADRDGMSTRAYSEGSLVFIDKQLFLTPATGRAFALVQVADLPEVRIKLENQVITRTDRKGRALLPNLRPYELNRIGIEQRDLPLDVSITTLELTVAPYADSGLSLTFPVQRERGILLHARLADGKAPPIGTRVEVVGEPQLFFTVGYEGMLYLEGLHGEVSLRLEWEEASCRIDLPPASAEEAAIRHLGEQRCIATP